MSQKQWLGSGDVGCYMSFAKHIKLFFCLTYEILFPSKTTELLLRSYGRIQKNVREADDCWISPPEVNRQGFKIG